MACPDSSPLDNPDSRARAWPSGWAVAAIGGTALLLLSFLRTEMLPIGVAAALAYLLHPGVGVLERRLRLPRPVAVLLLYLAVLGLAGLATWWGVAALRDETVGTLGRLPDLLAARLRELTGPELRLFGATMTPDELVGRALDGLEAWLLRPDPLLTAAGLLVVGPAALVLVAVLLFYFLSAGRQLAAGLLWLVPPAYRSSCRICWRRIDPMLRRYLHGILLVVAYTVIVAWLVLRFAFQVDFALGTAVLIGGLELVPVVGPAASMVLLAAVGLQSGGGLLHFALLAGLAVGLRVSIDAMVGPLVLGEAVTLHPVVVIVAFLVAGSLFGALGVLGAVPAAAAIKIVLGIVYDQEAAA